MLCTSLSLKAWATQSATVWLLCVSREWEPWDCCWAASVGVFVLMLLRGFGSWPHLKVGYSSQALGSGNNHITGFAIACLIGFWSETTGRTVDMGTLLPLGHCHQQVPKLPFTPQGGKIRFESFFFCHLTAMAWIPLEKTKTRIANRWLRIYPLNLMPLQKYQQGRFLKIISRAYNIGSIIIAFLMLV